MFERLNREQKEQVQKQIEAYERTQQCRIVKIPLGRQELELEIDPYVANPEIMNSGIQVVEYLAKNPELVSGKVATDMGTGSGIIGVACGVLKARKVFMPDIDYGAVKNASKNILNHHLGDVCEAFESNLFGHYGKREKSELQIFNHPFFSARPLEGKDWTRIMLADVHLLEQYFKQAPNYSTPDALYLMPWLTLAGNSGGLPDNDPGNQALKHGYEVVKVTEQKPVKHGLQQHLFKIYELKFHD